VSQFSSPADSVQTRGLNSSFIGLPFTSDAAVALPLAIAVSSAKPARQPAFAAALANLENSAGKEGRDMIFSNDGTVRNGARQVLVVSERVEGPSIR
jgi:hypothetical protein